MDLDPVTQNAALPAELLGMAELTQALPSHVVPTLSETEIAALTQYLHGQPAERERALRDVKYKISCHPVLSFLASNSDRVRTAADNDVLLYLALLRAASADCSILKAMTAMTDLLGTDILTRIEPFKEYQHKSRDRWGLDSIHFEYGFDIFKQYFDAPLVPSPIYASLVHDLDRFASRVDPAHRSTIPAVCLVQSSGAGKTRTATALADFGVHVIYISLAGPDSTGYPRPMPSNFTDFFKTKHPNGPAAMLITQIHAAHISKLFLTAGQFRDLQIVRLTSEPTWAVTQAYYKLVAAQAAQLIAIGNQYDGSPTELSLLLRVVLGGDRTRTVHDAVAEIAVMFQSVMGMSFGNDRVCNPDMVDVLQAHLVQSEATFRHFFAQEVVQRSFPASRRPASLAPVSCEHLQYLIVFDESRNLVDDCWSHDKFAVVCRALKGIRLSTSHPFLSHTPDAIFTLFLDSTPAVAEHAAKFRPGSWKQPCSGFLLQPLTNLNLHDILAPQWDAVPAEHLGAVRALWPSQLFCHGRPMWGIAATSPVECIKLARMKLVPGGHPFRVVEFRDSVESGLAVAMVLHRLPFTVRDHNLAYRLIGSSMATCARMEFRETEPYIIEATGKSEPVLAHVIAHIWANPHRRAAVLAEWAKQAVPRNQEPGQPMPLDLGRPDVFTAMLLWIFARDSALLGDRQLYLVDNWSAPVTVAELLTAMFGTEIVASLHQRHAHIPGAGAVLDQGLVSMTHFVETDSVPDAHALRNLFLGARALKMPSGHLMIPVVVPDHHGALVAVPDAMSCIIVHVLEAQNDALMSLADLDVPVRPAHPFVHVVMALCAPGNPTAHATSAAPLHGPEFAIHTVEKLFADKPGAEITLSPAQRAAVAGVHSELVGAATSTDVILPPVCANASDRKSPYYGAFVFAVHKYVRENVDRAMTVVATGFNAAVYRPLSEDRHPGEDMYFGTANCGDHRAVLMEALQRVLESGRSADF